MSTRLRRAAALIVAATAALVVLAGIEPAAADCVEPPPLDQAVADAPIVFVGTAVEVDGGSTARFRVEEVGAGPDLRDVVIRGGEGGGVVTSVDRSFVEGERYLVLPYADGADLRDNSCTSTQLWSEDLAALRPADARTVEAATEGAESATADPSSTLPWALAGLAAAGLLVGGAWGIRRRTR